MNIKSRFDGDSINQKLGRKGKKKLRQRNRFDPKKWGISFNTLNHKGRENKVENVHWQCGRMRECMRVSVCVWVHACEWVCFWVRVCLSACGWVCVCVWVWVWECVRVCVWVPVCAWMSIYLCLCACMHALECVRASANVLEFGFVNQAVVRKSLWNHFPLKFRILGRVGRSFHVLFLVVACR